MDISRLNKNALRMVTPIQKRPKGLPLLKNWRKYRDDITQERLAERAGISQGMISQLETGDSDYTGALLEALAFGLDCEPADLIMRNPLDPEAPWSIWDAIQPEDRPQAILVLKTFVKEKAA